MCSVSLKDYIFSHVPRCSFTESKRQCWLEERPCWEERFSNHSSRPYDKVTLRLGAIIRSTKDPAFRSLNAFNWASPVCAWLILSYPSTKEWFSEDGRLMTQSKGSLSSMAIEKKESRLPSGSSSSKSFDPDGAAWDACDCVDWMGLHCICSASHQRGALRRHLPNKWIHL